MSPRVESRLGWDCELTYSKEAKNANKNAVVSIIMFVMLMKLARISDLVQESVEYSSRNRLPWVRGSVEVSLSCAPKDHLELGIVMSWILKPLTAVK